MTIVKLFSLLLKKSFLTIVTPRNTGRHALVVFPIAELLLREGKARKARETQVGSIKNISFKRIHSNEA
jgi:hypothetical protein